MATLAQIRARIARKLKDSNYTDLSASTIDDEINRTIRFYQNHEFWFNTDVDVITLTANTQAIPSIPSDLVYPGQIYGFLVIDGNSKYPLTHLPIDEFKALDEDQIGLPRYWTFQDGSYLLLPTPDSAYTLNLNYIKSYADLSNDSDTNDFTNNVEDLIMLHTLKNLFAEDKQDPAYAASYEMLTKSELQMIDMRTRAIIGTGKIRLDLL